MYEIQIYMYEKYIFTCGRKKLYEVSSEPVFVQKHGVMCTYL